MDTVIGGPFFRGVSGGERKRVSIGHEILVDPSLLFLDEPTSGLDSTTALRIIQVIRNIAKVCVNPNRSHLQSSKFQPLEKFDMSIYENFEEFHE